MTNTNKKRFTTVVEGTPKRTFIALPFDPDEAWGPKPVHHVAGTINGINVRAKLAPSPAAPHLVLGHAWRRDCGIAPGDKVKVVLAAEGPQRDTLAPDIAAALAADAEAAAFFDSLAQFYRKAYLRWIDATKRRPDVRAIRIKQTVEFLRAGHKQRPE